MGTWHNDNVGFYSQMKGLQDRLRKSEEERLKLEEKFNSLSRSSQAEEGARLNTFRENYTKVLKADRMRCDRNETIMQTLERIESRASMLTAKTHRLKLLRKHYEAYISRLYPDWKKDTRTQSFNLKQFQPNSSYLGTSPLYQSNPAHGSVFTLPQSSPGIHHSSIILPDMSRRMSQANTPTIVVTEPPRTESSVLRHLEESSKFTPKSLFSPSVISDTKSNNTSEFTSYRNSHFKPEATSPALPLEHIYNGPGMYNDVRSNLFSENNRVDSLDKDQNTSGDFLSMSLSDDNCIKDIPKDTKPDCSSSFSKYQTNRWEHLAKAPSFGNKFSLDKKNEKTLEYSSPVSPRLRNSLSRTTSFDTLSKYGQDKNKYGYPSMSRRQSLSSDNLDLRSEDLYKPKVNSLDRTLNFGKYSSSINSDDYVFKKYLVQPSQHDSRKYDDKYRPASHIYLPGSNLLERKSSVDYTTKFDKELQGSDALYKNFDDKPSYSNRERYSNDRPIHVEKERKYPHCDDLKYQADSSRVPYYYQTDFEDNKNKTLNPGMERSALYKDKTYFDNDREFEEKEFRNNVLSRQSPIGRIIEEVNQFEETHKLKQLMGQNFNEENKSPQELEISQNRNQNQRLSMLPDEMESLTEKLNRSVRSNLSVDGDSNEKEKVSYDFSETNPNILSASSQGKLSENSPYGDDMNLVPKEELIQSSVEHAQSFHKNTTKNIPEDGAGNLDKAKVKFELPPESEDFKQNEKIDTVTALNDQCNVPKNGDILQGKDVTNDTLLTSTNEKGCEGVPSKQYFGIERPLSIDKHTDESDVNNAIERNNKISKISNEKPESFSSKGKVTSCSEKMHNEEQISKAYSESSANVVVTKGIEKEGENMIKMPSSEKEELNGDGKAESLTYEYKYEETDNEKNLLKSDIEEYKENEKGPYSYLITDKELMVPENQDIGAVKDIKSSNDLEENQQDQKEKSFATDTEKQKQYSEDNMQRNGNEDYYLDDLNPNDDQKHYYEGGVVSNENEKALEKSDQDQKEYEKQFTEETEQQQLYEQNIQDNGNQEYYSKDLDPNDQQVYYDENTVNQQYYEEDNQQIDQTYDDNKLYYEDNNYHPGDVQRVDEGVTQNPADQQYYEGNNYHPGDVQRVDEGVTQNPADQHYYEGNNYHPGDVQRVDEGVTQNPADQQYYEGNNYHPDDIQRVDEGVTQNPADQHYYEGNNYHPGDIQRVDEGVTQNPADQQYYEGNQHYYGDQGNTDGQQYYEGDPQYSANQQYYESGNQDQSKQYYEGTSKNVNGDADLVGPELYEDNGDQYYDKTQVGDDKLHDDKQMYEERYSGDQHVYEGNDEQYYKDNVQNIDGQYVAVEAQHAEGEQYYAGNEETNPSDQQYYEGNPEQSQYYGEHQDENYPQEPYNNNQQYYDQYAEGGNEYNQEQQYTEGDNYQYEYDKTYPEGYEQYPQDDNQYAEQYGPGNEYNHPEGGSGAQEYNVEEQNEAARGAEDPSYASSQEHRPSSADDQEQLDRRLDQHSEIPLQQELPPNPISEEKQKQTKKQTSLSKVLDSDTDSVNIGAEQNKDDSSDFDFSSEKK